MDTNRISLKICIASLALFATSAGAQTIYKQVDAGGRIMFTDRPSPEARVVASYETSRSARRQENDAEAIAEPVRGPAFAQEPRRIAQSEPAEIRALPEYRTFGEIRTAQDFRGNSTDVPSMAAPRATLRPVVAANDVERAVATYSPLTSALAMEKDAAESARRARREAHKISPAAVLVVKPVSHEREALPAHEGISTFYVLWVTTFFILAAGLLYVGFQTLRLILRGAFPRWELGLA